MAENENLVSIVIDASATEGAQTSVKDANKELARFKRSVDKFKGSLSSFSDTSKDTSASISKFNTFLKGFSKTLETNMLKMQKDVFKNVEPVFTKNLEGMIDRVLSKVETKVNNKIDKTSGSRSRSEPKSSTNADVVKPLIAKSQVAEGKQVADAIAEEFATLVRGVNGIAQPETKTRTQGKKAETSDTYKSISEALVGSQEKHTWANPLDRLSKTMDAPIKKIFKYDDPTYEKSLKRVAASASNAAKNNDFYGSSMRREMSSMLISLHILQTFGAHSQVFASAFGLIDNAVGHLLNVVLLPALPFIAQTAQWIHGIATAFQGLPPGVKSLISALVYIKIVSSLVSAMPLKDFASGIVAVYNAIKDPDSSRLVKFARAITEIFNAVTSNLLRAPISKMGEWIGNTRLGKRITGKRADGGPVNNSGVYLVGERGPELFAPGVSGSIIPNHAFKREDGGPVEAFPSLPGMSDIGSSLLGGAAGGLGAGGLTYLVTGSPQLALAGGAAGAGVGATIGPQIPGMVGGMIGTALSSPYFQGVIGGLNILTGTISSLLAPMAPLFGIVATTMGVVGGLKGAMGGSAEATTRVGNTINKTVATGTNNIAQSASGNARGGNSILSSILMRLSGCFRICAGSLTGVVPLPKDVTATKESVIRTEDRLKNIETKTEEIKRVNEEKLKRTEEISNKLAESETTKTSLVEKITSKLDEVKTRITEKVNETIKTITETSSKTTETKITGVLDSVDTSKVAKPEVNVKGVAEPEIDMSRVRKPEFYMEAIVKTARVTLDTGIEFPAIADIIGTRMGKDAKIDPIPTDATIKEAKISPETKVPELKTEGTIERVKVAPEILAGGGTEVPVKADVKEVKPISQTVTSRIPLVDLPAKITVDFAEFQRAVNAQPLEARAALQFTINNQKSKLWEVNSKGDGFVLKNDIPVNMRLAELKNLEALGLKRVGDHLEFDKDIISRVTAESLKKGESVEVPMRLTLTPEEIARANTLVKNTKFTSPEVPVKITTPGSGEKGGDFKLPEIKFDKEGLERAGRTAGGFAAFGIAMGINDYIWTGKVDWAKIIIELGIAGVGLMIAQPVVTALATAIAGAAGATAVTAAFAVFGAAMWAVIGTQIAVGLEVAMLKEMAKHPEWTSVNNQYQNTTTLTMGQDGGFTQGIRDIVGSNKSLEVKIAELAQKGIPVDVSMDIDSVTSTTQSYIDTITGGLQSVLTGHDNGGVSTDLPSAVLPGGAGYSAPIGPTQPYLTTPPGQNENIISPETNPKLPNQVGNGGKINSPAGSSTTTGLVGQAINWVGGLLGFAAGGNVSGGIPVIVGEKGPELFVPSGDGSIIPNDKSFLNSNAQGPTNSTKNNQDTTINMYCTFNVQGKDEKTMFESIMKQLKPELQRMKV